MRQYEVGDAIAVFKDLLYKSKPTLGRVTALAGSEYNGVYPMVEMHTPHGTKITVGIMYVKHLTDKYQKQLDEFEQLAKDESGAYWYGGKLNDP